MAKRIDTAKSVIVIISGIILIFFIYMLGSNVYQRMIISSRPTPTSTALPSATITSSPTEEVPTEAAVSEPLEPFESTGRENSPNLDRSRLRIGKLTIEYPLVMTVLSSETVVLYIFVPSETANEDLSEFERISLSVDQPEEIDLFSFSNFIVVYESMRATLRSTSFTIEPLQTDEPQLVNIDQSEELTTWEWIVQAPDYTGEQIVAISTYLGNDTQPSWVGSIKINVISPTDTPLPTPSNTPKPPTPTITPLPTNTPTSTPTLTVLEDVGREIRENLNAWLFYVLGSLGTILAGLFGMIKKHLNRKDAILLKKKTLNGVKGKEKKSLEDEITHLESIKWWQFWR